MLNNMFVYIKVTEVGSHAFSQNQTTHDFLLSWDLGLKNVFLSHVKPWGLLLVQFPSLGTGQKV